MAWTDLTSRKQQLDRLIEASGIELNNSKSCLRKVMSKIGASSSEEEFVAKRIQLRFLTQALLDETDKFISDTEAMLDRFAKEDEEWRRRDKDLGFNF